MKVWIAVRTCLASLLIAASAHAQSVSRLPSPEEACLTPDAASRGMPAYPDGAWARRDGATVVVDFIFEGSDAPPRVERQDGGRDDEFVRSIRDFSEAFRVPCMRAGAAPVRMSFTFDFVPNDGRKVMWFSPQLVSADADPEFVRRSKACPLNVKSLRTAEYPREAQRRASQGVVLMNLTFSAPDRGPDAHFAYDGGDAAFVRVLKPLVDDLRLPCSDGKPISFQIEMHFRFADGERARLQDMDLTRFLGLVDASQVRGTYFDFSAMKCPFDVAFSLRRPFAQNRVGEVGERQPQRGAFLAWLQNLDLKLPDPDKRRLLMLSESRIRVPCGTLDL